MTMYSIMPMEVIFAGMDQQTYNYVEVVVGGIPMQVERVSVDQAKIVRLLSCRPEDYLNPLYNPGTMIFYQPSVEL
ncbi:hypothetical protein EHS13_16070 [Paenibacillus psychroresistens]|uniref:Uncharacterized protein n=1 Tax=Paenibacillus psychroresistens TaxID=1778678 RepID=A0A6B8RLS3_9BACL|nr:YlzJ-like family protein [Paenibacillus psychroresistens]QGQ96288.1 hypothetical protein EHS13_16070 [Paenibacillus psychroresistens]